MVKQPERVLILVKCHPKVSELQVSLHRNISKKNLQVSASFVELMLDLVAWIGSNLITSGRFPEGE